MLNVNELKVKQLLEEAIEEYGVEHVDIDADYDSYGNEVLSIYYHSYRNSFGIGEHIPLEGINLNRIEEIADELDISFQNCL